MADPVKALEKVIEQQVREKVSKELVPLRKDKENLQPAQKHKFIEWFLTSRWAPLVSVVVGVLCSIPLISRL